MLDNIDMSSIITASSSEYIRRNLHRILWLTFGISLSLVVGKPMAVLIVVPFMLTAATPFGVIFNTLTFLVCQIKNESPCQCPKDSIDKIQLPTPVSPDIKILRGLTFFFVKDFDIYIYFYASYRPHQIFAFSENVKI